MSPLHSAILYVPAWAIFFKPFFIFSKPNTPATHRHPALIVINCYLSLFGQRLNGAPCLPFREPCCVKAKDGEATYIGGMVTYIEGLSQ